MPSESLTNFVLFLITKIINMKSLTLIFTISSTIFIIMIMVSCNKESTLKSDKIPSAIQNSFRTAHAEVKDESWEKDGDYFEAEYDKNGMEQTILYDNSGNVIRTESEISNKDIPSTIGSYVLDYYKGYRIVDAATIIKSDGSFYKIEIKKGNSEQEFLFDMEGNFVSEDMDDTDVNEGEEDDD